MSEFELNDEDLAELNEGVEEREGGIEGGWANIDDESFDKQLFEKLKDLDEQIKNIKIIDDVPSRKFDSAYGIPIYKILKDVDPIPSENNESIISHKLNTVLSPDIFDPIAIGDTVYMNFQHYIWCMVLCDSYRRKLVNMTIKTKKEIEELKEWREELIKFAEERDRENIKKSDPLYELKRGVQSTPIKSSIRSTPKSSIKSSVSSSKSSIKSKPRSIRSPSSSPKSLPRSIKSSIKSERSPSSKSSSSSTPKSPSSENEHKAGEYDTDSEKEDTDEEKDDENVEENAGEEEIEQEEIESLESRLRSKVAELRLLYDGEEGKKYVESTLKNIEIQFKILFKDCDQYYKHISEETKTDVFPNAKKKYIEQLYNNAISGGLDTFMTSRLRKTFLLATEDQPIIYESSDEFIGINENSMVVKGTNSKLWVYDTEMGIFQITDTTEGKEAESKVFDPEANEWIWNGKQPVSDKTEMKDWNKKMKDRVKSIKKHPFYVSDHVRKELESLEFPSNFPSRIRYSSSEKRFIEIEESKGENRELALGARETKGKFEREEYYRDKADVIKNLTKTEKREERIVKRGLNLFGKALMKKRMDMRITDTAFSSVRCFVDDPTIRNWMKNRIKKLSFMVAYFCKYLYLSQDENESKIIMQTKEDESTVFSRATGGNIGKKFRREKRIIGEIKLDIAVTFGEEIVDWVVNEILGCSTISTKPSFYETVGQSFLEQFDEINLLDTDCDDAGTLLKYANCMLLKYTRAVQQRIKDSIDTKIGEREDGYAKVYPIFKNIENISRKIYGYATNSLMIALSELKKSKKKNVKKLEIIEDCKLVEDLKRLIRPPTIDEYTHPNDGCENIFSDDKLENCALLAITFVIVGMIDFYEKNTIDIQTVEHAIPMILAGTTAEGKDIIKQIKKVEMEEKEFDKFQKDFLKKLKRYNVEENVLKWTDKSVIMIYKYAKYISGLDKNKSKDSKKILDVLFIANWI